MPDKSYLAVLLDELAHAKKRLKAASATGLPVVKAQISEIQRDIERYSAIEREQPKT